eukprot:g1355.t1
MTWTRPQPSATTAASTTSLPPRGPLPRGPAVAPRAGGNRVWVNTETKSSVSGGSSPTSSNGSNGPTDTSRVRAPATLGRTATAPLGVFPCRPPPRGSAAVSKTSKSVNRVWTNASSAGSASQNSAAGAAQGGGSSGSRTKTNLAKAARPTPPAFSTVTNPSAPRGSGVSMAPRRSHGHLVWTKPGGGAAGASSRTTIPTGVLNRTPVQRPAATATTASASSMKSGSAGRDSQGRPMVSAAAAGVRHVPKAAAVTCAAATHAATSTGASLAAKPVTRYSGSGSRPSLTLQPKLNAAPAAPALAPTPAATAATAAPSALATKRKSVARYSGSASRQPKALSKHEIVGNQVARYSGTARGGARSSSTSGLRSSASRFVRGGRGGPAWRGRGRTGPAGRGSSARGYWPLGSSRRGLHAWGGTTGWRYGVGLGGWGGFRSRYSPWTPPAGRFGAHPALGRSAAGRWAHPWAGRVAAYWRGRGRGRGRGAFNPAPGRSRPAPLPRGKRVRYKNRTLIRARGVLPQQPLVARAALISSSAAAAAAAARRAAVARRALSAVGGHLATLGAAPPTKFVRSGKHGMAIRRVNSLDLAARRAAAASALSPAAKRLKVSTGNTAARSTAAARECGKADGGGANASGGSKALGGGAEAISKKSVSATTAASAALLARKAALLSKAGARSVAARRAAVVVAGARAKRSRLQLVRNMTLYREKGEVTIVGSSGSSKGKEAASKNKKSVQKTNEPCLFFCRFGKCSKSDEACRYVHDKSKVAVCRAFLRKGGCAKGDKCLLTHAIQAEKMPVCIYFERGMCFTPNCPYLHVKVSQNAAVCPRFLKGHCPDGTACRLRHELPNPRKRTRDVSDGGDQGAGDDEASCSKKTKSTAAPETGTGGAAKEAAVGFFEGKSGESVLRSPSAAALVREGGRTGAGTAGGGRGGGVASGKVEGGQGEEPAGNRRTVPGLDGEGGDEDEDEDEDDDLKPAFFRKRKERH